MSVAETLAVATRDLDQARRDLDERGYCIVPDVLSPSEVGALKERLVQQAAGERARGVAFRDGGSALPNQRVWMLMNKGKVFRDLMLHPIVSALMDHLLGPDFLLSSLTANIAWMLDDFTDENGGTRLAPASHLNQDATPRSSAYAPEQPASMPTLEDTIGAEGKAGSILCFDGRIWHGTGANRTNGARHALLSYHCRPFVRQQENFVLGLDPMIRAAERPALLNRLGFATWAGLGRVESPRPAQPLFVSTGAVGPLCADGAPRDLLA